MYLFLKIFCNRFAPKKPSILEFGTLLIHHLPSDNDTVGLHNRLESLWCHECAVLKSLNRRMDDRDGFAA